ncbi:MAG: aspartate aminotransferase family protein [Alphaproteobacteria bacterium]|nr:aspartate aminotransferase family protein [Alphaproteobacteria bacterium]
MISAVIPTYARAPLSFVKGEGSWLIEADGSRYLDLGAGIAVTSLGHAHPRLVAALKDQAEQLWHTSNLYNIPNQEKLAEQLVAATFADTVFFTNSGAEAMECAIKMTRKHFSAKGEGERSEIIAFTESFHGRTLGTIAAAGAAKLVNGFGPRLEGFTHVPFGDLEAVAAAITPQTAGILLEPVQGEGGIVPAEDAFLQGLRSLCDEHGLLLIMDEIQCGMGRTGKLFAHEWAGISPDIMGVAKGIGGGFPLGACLATERAASGMVAGTHGSTYGGNPLACAVGSAVMDEIATPDFLAGVNRKAGAFRQKLEGLVAAHPQVFEAVRGAGLMIGLACKVPNMDVVRAGYDQHLLTIPGGQNVVRLLPALTISMDEIADAVARLDQAASAIEAKL